MKTHHLLIIFALVHSIVFADAPAGILGIPWGTSPDEAKKQFRSRINAHINLANSNEQQLTFDGGKFAGFRLRNAKLFFANKQLCEVSLYLDAPSPKHEKELAALKAMLKEKYGDPQKEELVGGGIEVLWTFPVPDSQPRIIWLIQNTAGEQIRLVYRSDSTKAKALAGKVAGAAEPGKRETTPKPNSTSPKDKDDL